MQGVKGLAVGALLLEGRHAQEARAALRALGWQRKGPGNVTRPQAAQLAAAGLPAEDSDARLLAFHLSHAGAVGLAALLRGNAGRLGEPAAQLSRLLDEGKARFAPGLRPGMTRNEALPGWEDASLGEAAGITHPSAPPKASPCHAAKQRGATPSSTHALGGGAVHGSSLRASHAHDIICWQAAVQGRV